MGTAKDEVTHQVRSTWLFWGAVRMCVSDGLPDAAAKIRLIHSFDFLADGSIVFFLPLKQVHP